MTPYLPPAGNDAHEHVAALLRVISDPHAAADVLAKIKDASDAAQVKIDEAAAAGNDLARRERAVSDAEVELATRSEEHHKDTENLAARQAQFQEQSDQWAHDSAAMIEKHAAKEEELRVREEKVSKREDEVAEREHAAEATTAHATELQVKYEKALSDLRGIVA